MTEFFRGIVAEESIGERAPDHRLTEDGADPLAEITYRVAEDQTDRYAAASGDHFAIHLDDDFARAVGLPGRIVHGLCTMAFAARAVLEAAGVDDPRRVRRVAVRFSAPLFPGDTVTTRVWRDRRRLRLRVARRRRRARSQGRPARARMIALDKILAIDVHTHVEVGRHGEDGLLPEWREAAATSTSVRRRHRRSTTLPVLPRTEHGGGRLQRRRRAATGGRRHRTTRSPRAPRPTPTS